MSAPGLRPDMRVVRSKALMSYALPMSCCSEQLMSVRDKKLLKLS